jgi:NAD(P)-dependent dehydrogenase (short-subunit alcohol dehydrogenase family)
MTSTSGPAGEFAGIRVLVTGGTKGIGAAVAVRFAGAGADVVVAARTPVDEPPTGRFVAADIATADGTATVAAKATQLLGGNDVLINNAGSPRAAPVACAGYRHRGRPGPVLDERHPGRHRLPSAAGLAAGVVGG